MGEGQTLCKWGRKRIAEELGSLMQLVRRPTVVCRGCGRAVADERLLCKPLALAPGDEPKQKEKKKKKKKKAKQHEKKQKKKERKREQRAQQAQRDAQGAAQ